jgi:hypothetical protein
MFPFSQAVTPAVRSHLDAQFSFFNDMSKSLARALHNVCALNMQLSQTLLEESSIAGQQLLTTEHGTDALSVAAARAQPAADKLRAYQQHISRVLADGQIDLSRVAEQHVQVTARTARNLADTVAQVASDETEKSALTQRETMKNFRDPFEQHGAARGTASAAHCNMQSANGHADFDSHGASVQGNVQGTPGAQGGAKAGVKAS